MKEKILILDDDLEILSDLNELLYNDFDIEICQTIKEAREKVFNKNYSLIISDINLPDGLGLDFIQSILLKKDIPVLFMTGSNDREFIKKALKLGAVGFIDKPFDLNEIQKSVNKALYLYKENVSNKMKKLLKLTI